MFRRKPVSSSIYSACIVTAGYTLWLVFTAGAAAAAGDSYASVRGIVTNAVTGEPLRKAYVRLMPASDTANVRPTVTDEEGRFAFKDIRPGSYTLEAEHQGFIEAKYGEATGAPVELSLAANQDLSGLGIGLMPPAAISGRVTNEDGDPWTHVVVNVFRSRWERGNRKFEGFTSAEVDDKGEFRAGHLPPGRYYVRAEPDANWERRNRVPPAPRLQPAWYPSSLDSPGAVPVVLLAGQELAGTEIRLRRSSVYRIRGRVPGIQDIPLLPGPNAWMRPRLSVSSTPEITGNGPSGVMHADGSFEVEGVAPGRYQIRVEEGMLHDTMTLAAEEVRIDDHDLEGVVLAAHAPRPVHGVVRTETGDAALPEGLLLWLDSAEGLLFEETATLRPDGNFVFDNVPSGRYSVHVRGGPPGYYLKTTRYGSIASSDAVISIDGSADTIELMLSAAGARVNGIVRRSTAAQSAAAQVVLLPNTSDPALQIAGIRAAVLDQSGRFTVKDAVRPGEYTLYAFEGVPDGAWTDSEFMKGIEGRGIRITAEAGAGKIVEVPVIPQSDIAALLTRLGMN
jgi:hypothetical protein